MDGDFFYVMGGILVLAAVVLAFLGIRGSASFPGNRAMLLGVVAVFALIVGGTMAFAVDLSEEEQEHREGELAQEEQEAQGEAEAEAPSPSGGAAPSPAATVLDVTSPEDGGLVFEPTGLESQPGDLTLTYANPSQVPHSLALATANGNVLGETSVFADGEESVELADLAPGKYVFYCTVPGHREGGMEGDLTVVGGPT
jgi:plastocyanin